MNETSNFNAWGGLSRRAFLDRAGMGMGGLALAAMLGRGTQLDPLAGVAPHFPAKAKHVIHGLRFRFRFGFGQSTEVFR